eukprot:gene5858-7287_t
MVYHHTTYIPSSSSSNGKNTKGGHNVHGRKRGGGNFRQNGELSDPTEKYLNKELKIEFDSAIHSNLHPYKMVSLELKELPDFKSFQTRYCDIRNKILTQWLAKPTEALKKSDILNVFHEIDRKEAGVIFDFLERWGYINSGIFTDMDCSINVNEEVLEMRKSKKIVVIGAGIAGLAAARQLKFMGYDVTVLEARDRVGGRIVSADTKTFGAPVDLGGDILLGLEGNPLTTICKQLGLHLSYIKPECPLYDSDIVPDRVDGFALKLFNTILDNVAKHLKKTTGSKSGSSDINLADAIEEEIKQLTATADELQVLDWLVTNLEKELHSSLSKVGANGWNHFDEYDFRGENCLIREGFSTITNSLAKDLNIQYSCPVYSIEYSSDNQSKILSKDGSVLFADICIITVPLGVLKSKQITFNPPLPNWKSQVINRLGYGVVNKVILKFTDFLWMDSFKFNNGPDFFGCTKTPLKGEGHLFLNLYRCNQMPILVAYIVGKAAKVIESLTNEILVSRIMKTLETMFGRDVPDPIETTVTRWEKDPYSLGSGSFISVESEVSDYDLMSNPVDSIFFAGEATCIEHPNTIAGALMSGYREAGRTDKYFNKLFFKENSIQPIPTKNEPLKVYPKYYKGHNTKKNRNKVPNELPKRTHYSETYNYLLFQPIVAEPPTSVDTIYEIIHKRTCTMPQPQQEIIVKTEPVENNHNDNTICTKYDSISSKHNLKSSRSRSRSPLSHRTLGKRSRSRSRSRSRTRSRSRSPRRRGSHRYRSNSRSLSRSPPRLSINSSSSRSPVRSDKYHNNIVKNNLNSNHHSYIQQSYDDQQRQLQQHLQPQQLQSPTQHHHYHYHQTHSNNLSYNNPPYPNHVHSTYQSSLYQNLPHSYSNQSTTPNSTYQYGYQTQQPYQQYNYQHQQNQQNYQQSTNYPQQHQNQQNYQYQQNNQQSTHYPQQNQLNYQQSTNYPQQNQPIYHYQQPSQPQLPQNLYRESLQQSNQQQTQFNPHSQPQTHLPQQSQYQQQLPQPPQQQLQSQPPPQQQQLQPQPPPPQQLNSQEFVKIEPPESPKQSLINSQDVARYPSPVKVDNQQINSEKSMLQDTVQSQIINIKKEPQQSKPVPNNIVQLNQIIKPPVQFAKKPSANNSKIPTKPSNDNPQISKPPTMNIPLRKPTLEEMEKKEKTDVSRIIINEVETKFKHYFLLNSKDDFRRFVRHLTHEIIDNEKLKSKEFIRVNDEMKTKIVEYVATCFKQYDQNK